MGCDRESAFWGACLRNSKRKQNRFTFCSQNTLSTTLLHTFSRHKQKYITMSLFAFRNKSSITAEDTKLQKKHQQRRPLLTSLLSCLPFFPFPRSEPPSLLSKAAKRTKTLSSRRVKQSKQTATQFIKRSKPILSSRHVKKSRQQAATPRFALFLGSPRTRKPNPPCLQKLSILSHASLAVLASLYLLLLFLLEFQLSCIKPAITIIWFLTEIERDANVEYLMTKLLREMVKHEDDVGMYLARLLHEAFEKP